MGLHKGLNMGLNVTNLPENIVDATTMNRGDLAVIVSSCYNANQVGKVVQRYINSLVILGEDNGWSSYFSNHSGSGDIKVRICPKGSTFKLD